MFSPSELPITHVFFQARIDHLMILSPIFAYYIVLVNKLFISKNGIFFKE